MDSNINIGSFASSYTTTDKTDHDELKIMKEDWEFIQDKVNNVKLPKFNINVTELVIGVLIPYVFQFFSLMTRKKVL